MQLVYIKNSNITSLKHLTETEYFNYKEIIESINRYRTLYLSVDKMTDTLKDIHNLIDDYANMVTDGVELHTKIGNRVEALLYFVRNYEDTLEHTLSNYYGKDSDILRTFRIEKNSAFDTNESYRFVEELRNFTQHRAFPQCNINVQNMDGERRVSILINKDSLLEDKKFKSTKIPSEYSGIEAIDIIKHLDIMFGCLCLINDKICDISAKTTRFEEYFAIREQYKQYTDGLCLLTRTEINHNDSNFNIQAFDFLVVDTIIKMEKEKIEYLG